MVVMLDPHTTPMGHGPYQQLAHSATENQTGSVHGFSRPGVVWHVTNKNNKLAAMGPL